MEQVVDPADLHLAFVRLAEQFVNDLDGLPCHRGILSEFVLHFHNGGKGDAVGCQPGQVAVERFGQPRDRFLRNGQIRVDMLGLDAPR